MKKKNVSRFVVSFTVEAEHVGEASAVCEAIEDAVTQLVDSAADWRNGGIKAPAGVKITDAVNFTAQVE